MSRSLLNWMKDVYTKIKTESLDWKEYHPNNMPQNPVRGLYTEFVHENEDGTYIYIKFSIRYIYRTDDKGCTYPDEGIKYYALQKIEIKDLEFDPTLFAESNYNTFSDNSFLDVFEDVETAKSVAKIHLIHILYPYTFILSEEEGDEWNEFLNTFEQ